MSLIFVEALSCLNRGGFHSDARLVNVTQGGKLLFPLLRLYLNLQILLVHMAIQFLVFDHFKFGNELTWLWVLVLSWGLFRVNGWSPGESGLWINIIPLLLNLHNTPLWSIGFILLTFLTPAIGLILCSVFFNVLATDDMQDFFAWFLNPLFDGLRRLRTSGYSLLTLWSTVDFVISRFLIRGTTLWGRMF